MHSFQNIHTTFGGFPGGLDGKESAWNVGDPGLIPELGRFPGQENGNPLQYSFLESSMDRGAWWAIIHGVTKSWTLLKKLSMHSTHNRNVASYLITLIFIGSSGKPSWHGKWHIQFKRSFDHVLWSVNQGGPRVGIENQTGDEMQ